MKKSLTNKNLKNLNDIINEKPTVKKENGKKVNHVISESDGDSNEENTKNEKIIHKHFKERRYLGEWFDIEPEEAENFIKTKEQSFIKRNAPSIYTAIDVNLIIQKHEETKRYEPKEEKKNKTCNNKIQEICDFEEHVLTEPLTRFKKIEGHVYFRKSTKEYFDIRYKNHQWIIRRLKKCD